MLTDITALIVEDEKKASEALEDLIHMVNPDVKLLHGATSVKEAVERIHSSSPNLIFLDIQLGDENSFDILRKIPDGRFEVIFITAYSDYAIDAFKFSAVDYLLKPVDPERLSRAIDEAIERIRKKERPYKLDTLLDNLTSDKPKKLVLSTMDFVHVIDISTIIKCQSSINYTIFYLQGNKEIMVSKTLKEYDEQLSPHGFFRSHKSWLINMSFVKGYNKKDGGGIMMEDGSEVPVSLAKKEEFMKRLRNFF